MKRLVRATAIVAVCIAGTGQAHAAEVATGANHTVVRTSAGAVWTWGYNLNGQLGIGNTTQKTAPNAVTALSVGVTSVAAGTSHTAALKSDGTVWTWGLNTNGQLGDASTTQRTSPVQVAGLAGVTAIACGDAFCLAVKSDGTVWSWGLNTNGQLGDGTTTQRTSPVQVSGLTGVSAVSGGSSHSVAVKTDGTAWSWGYNVNGQLGDGTLVQKLTPVQVLGLSAATQVSSAQQSNRALKSDGTVWAWGANTNGQLGDGTVTRRTSPVQLTGITGGAQLGGGWAHALSVKNDSTAWAWGANASGQLGDSTTTQQNAPALIPTLSTIQAVSTGRGDHSVAVTTDGVVWAWGKNANGQVGDGTTLLRLAPVQLSDPNFSWRVATPTLSPVAGTYTAAQNVIVSTATTGATIHYTTNGASPTTSDPTVASGGIVVVDRTMTLKAIAVNAGTPSSNIASASYNLRPATPTFSPAQGTYTSARTVTIACATSGAALRYTTDASEPTDTSTVYTAALNVATTTTIKAKAFKTDWDPSLTATATYTMNFGTLAAPTASPAAGSYTSSVAVTLAAGSATIHYTTNGTTPTTSSAVYTGPLTFDVTTTLKAKAFQPDYTASAVTTATYTIEVATPTFSPDGGSHPAGSPVSIATATAGATIRYTLDGTDPTTTDPVIASGATVIVGNFTLKATAWKTGCVTSTVKAAAFSVSGQLTSGMVAGGGSHSLAVRPDGTVWSWGYNYYGQLGACQRL